VRFYVVRPSALRRSEESKSGEQGGAPRDDMVWVARETVPMCELRLDQGCELVVAGTVAFESDAPARCFTLTYEKGKDQRVSYMRCVDFACNWICPVLCQQIPLSSLPVPPSPLLVGVCHELQTRPQARLVYVEPRAKLWSDSLLDGFTFRFQAAATALAKRSAALRTLKQPKRKRRQRKQRSRRCDHVSMFHEATPG
jgi:hypothetical protein